MGYALLKNGRVFAKLDGVAVGENADENGGLMFVHVYFIVIAAIGVTIAVLAWDIRRKTSYEMSSEK